MYIIGLDLSGPSNIKDTACAVFRKTAEYPTLQEIYLGLTDPDILELVNQLAAHTAVFLGIDAPLSYNPGGGDRPSDRQLRKVLIEKGAHPGSVMPPTMTRMVYLTLRGIFLAHMLDEIAQIVEVHPGAAMILRQAPLEAVRLFKTEKAARRTLLTWLDRQGLQGITTIKNPADHHVASIAAALATWDWIRNKSAWIYLAERPFHPYDFAC